MRLFPKVMARETSSLNIMSVVRSHIGRVRTVNEDRVLNCPESRLWAVADGMGGHSFGDQAATIVVRALADISKGSVIDDQAIKQGLAEANRKIFALGREDRHICGSTVAGLHIGPRGASIFWAGDSRVYRFRAGQLECMTRDHSVVQEMIDARLIDEMQARRHPQANVITRAAGVAEILVVEFIISPVLPGDVYLLCSDGLSSLVDEQTIAGLISTEIGSAANALEQAALTAGGNDNISVLLIKVDTADLP